MDDACLVERGEPRRDLPESRERPFYVAEALAFVLERSAFDELHHQKRRGTLYRV